MHSFESKQNSRLHIILDGPWKLYHRTPLPGWQMLGTVQRGMSIGALGLSPIGFYAQINAGVIRSLDQRKTIACLNFQKSPHE